MTVCNVYLCCRKFNDCMMSRLIIKNLPRNIKQDKLKQIFSEHGTVTDVKLSYTKDGKFRRFAFVGFKDSNQALKAKEHINSSLILNQRVVVEQCNNFNSTDSTKNDNKSSKLKNPGKDSTEQLKPSVGGKVDSPASVTLSDLDFLKLKKNSAEDGSEITQKNPQIKGNDSLSSSRNQFTLRVRNAPSKLSEKMVVEFFYPVVPASLKVLKGKARSGALVTFSSKKDMETALKLNGDCIAGRVVKLQAVNQGDVDLSSCRTTWQEKMSKDRSKIDIEEVADSGRLFVRNLSYLCTEEDLEQLFGTFGTLSEVHLPLDNMTRKNMGIGFITFMFPEHAVKALNDVDGTAFQGRMIHVLPAKSRPESKQSGVDSSQNSSYKKEKAQNEKSFSQQTYNWNTLFIGTDAVAGAIAEKYNISKGEFLSVGEKESTAVRVALGETQIVQETRQFLLDSGICLDAFSQPNAERSKSVILAKNLPAGATAGELRNVFEPHGDLGRVLLAPAGVTAVIEFLEPSQARQAFVKQAYRKFHHKPLFLEWAPINVFTKSYSEFKSENESEHTAEKSEGSDNTNVDNDNATAEEGATLFVKNINFTTKEEDMRSHFQKCGTLHMCTISKKKSHKKEELLSMGYGFVQYLRKADADKALKNLQSSLLDRHQLELKRSNHATKTNIANLRKKQLEKKQTSTKILVRNVPFQADRKEITSVFKTFGELKSVRLPKKLSISDQSGAHRGFAFVDFITKQDAKKAFQALCHSTHLYGRRLVLEWAGNEEDSLAGLRRKTAEHFHTSKKFKGNEEFEKTLSLQTEQ